MHASVKKEIATYSDTKINVFRIFRALCGAYAVKNKLMKYDPTCVSVVRTNINNNVFIFFSMVVSKLLPDVLCHYFSSSILSLYAGISFPARCQVVYVVKIFCKFLLYSV